MFCFFIVWPLHLQQGLSSMLCGEFTCALYKKICGYFVSLLKVEIESLLCSGFGPSSHFLKTQEQHCCLCLTGGGTGLKEAYLTSP